jgi:hypothetical protein
VKNFKNLTAKAQRREGCEENASKVALKKGFPLCIFASLRLCGERFSLFAA